MDDRPAMRVKLVVVVVVVGIAVGRKNRRVGNKGGTGYQNSDKDGYAGDNGGPSVEAGNAREEQQRTRVKRRKAV